MGKSSKKSAAKVDVVPVPLSGKKGKRTAENEIENVTSAKKQKAERDETVVANKLNARKKQPKKAASSSSEESDISNSDSEPSIVSKMIPTPAKNGSIAAKISQSDTSSGSSSSSESDSDDSDDKLATVLRNGGGQNCSSEDADSDSSDEEVESSGPSESDESSSSDEDDVTKVAPAIAPKGKVSSSDDESDDEEDSSDSDDESEAIKAKGAPAANCGKPTAKKAVDVSSSSEGNSDDGSDDESSDDEPSKVLPSKKVQASNESSSSGESSDEDESDEDESDEEENEKQSLKTPNKKDTDVEMVDSVKSSASTFQKTPKTPAIREATRSKTLFVANLSFSVEESHVHEFFKEAGEIVDVRFASDAEGNFRGFAHVEFATPEAAQKAMGLHEQELLGRPVRLDVARERERGAFTPQSRENNSFQRGRAQGQSIFVKGFDASLSEDEIRNALQQHFASCGEIARVSIPPDRENGGFKGIAYMDFTDTNGLNAALKKDNSDFGGGYYLNVREATPRDGNGGRGSGGRDGGRFSRSGGRDGGRRGGRDGGHRGGRDGGHRGGRSGGRGSDRGRGRGSVTAIASGKKITFGDD